jgi:N-methylhydantoinase A
MLQVGPGSAGARPGPACYGNGGERPTVTDANVVLGRLNPEFLLGGALRIAAERSYAAIEKHVAAPRGIAVVEAAAAIIAVADTNMAHAVRFVSVERGLDPADFMLTAFGGAGPVHAASVAQQLGVAGVLVPPGPGVLCAMGVLVNDLQADVSRTRIVSETAADCSTIVDRCYGELEERARSTFSRQQADGARVMLYRTADVRYLGQNHELTVEAPAGRFDQAALATVKDVFHAAHRELFGYASPDKKLELVTFRVRARLAGGGREFADAASGARRGAVRPVATRSVYFGEAGFMACPIFERDSLGEGDRLAGPAVVEQMDCTTVIPPGFSARVDGFLNLLLRSDT